MKQEEVVLYDGFCKLCSRTVNWVKRNDRKGRFSFRPQQADPLQADPLQGNEQTIKQNPAMDAEEETVVLLVGEKRYERSTAAIRIAMGLRFPWPLMAVLLLVPRFLRDAVYDLVARNRKKWFGEHSSCYLPED